MTKAELQHKETLLIEALMSALDSRESAKTAEAPMILYLAELLVQRTRQELADIRVLMERTDDSSRNDGDAAA